MNILTYKDLIKGEDKKNDKYERLQTTSYINTRESYDDSNIDSQSNRLPLNENIFFLSVSENFDFKSLRTVSSELSSISPLLLRT